MTSVLTAFIVVMLIDIPTVHLVLPWRTARYVALMLGTYGLLWMVALLVSIHAHPHLATHRPADPLRRRVRSHDSVGRHRCDRDAHPFTSRGHQVDRTAPRRALSVSVSMQSILDIALRNPIRVVMPDGAAEHVEDVRVFADDPRALVTSAEGHVALAHKPSDEAPHGRRPRHRR